MHSPEETEQVSRAHQKTTRRTRAEGFLYERIDLNQSISKIQSEMEVAPRYKLLTLLKWFTLLIRFALFTLLKLFIPLKLFYTAQTLSCMPILLGKVRTLLIMILIC